MRDHCVNSQFEFMRPAHASSVADVAAFYQMLGTVESYDEAMVALALSLRVPLSDVVYIASKNSSQQHATDGNGARLIAASLGGQGNFSKLTSESDSGNSHVRCRCRRAH